MKESLIGKTKFYNNRPVTILKEEGHGFVFVVAELNLSHDVTGANWCTMCMAGGDFIASHTCEFAQEVIDNLMENIEDHEVFWVSERYLKDEPFEFKKYQQLVDENEKLESTAKNTANTIDRNIKTIEDQSLEIENLKGELSDIQLKLQNAQHDLMLAEKEEVHIQPLPQTIETADARLSLKELLYLYECRTKLEALESRGVDNWEWYGESLGDLDFESEAINEVARILKK